STYSRPGPASPKGEPLPHVDSWQQVPAKELAQVRMDRRPVRHQDLLSIRGGRVTHVGRDVRLAHVSRMEVAHEERELGEAHQIEVGFDVAFEVLREGRQRGDEIHAGGTLLNGEQQLLLPNRPAEVTQQVAVSGTDVLERVPAVEVLRAR